MIHWHSMMMFGQTLYPFLPWGSVVCLLPGLETLPLTRYRASFNHYGSIQLVQGIPSIQKLQDWFVECIFTSIRTKEEMTGIDWSLFSFGGLKVKVTSVAQSKRKHPKCYFPAHSVTLPVMLWWKISSNWGFYILKDHFHLTTCKNSINSHLY